MTPQEALEAAIRKMEGVTSSKHPSGTLILQAGEARLRVTPRGNGTWLVTPPGREYRRVDKLAHYILAWGWKNQEKK